MSQPVASPNSQDNPDRAKSFLEVLAEELKAIGELRKKRDVTRPADPPAVPDPCPETLDLTLHAAHKSKLVGLAFSGGGIRSATFNLGVLQALAEMKILKHFDYLSTVSGGGYIGGWLAAWIKRTPSGVAGVETALRPERTATKNHQESPQIRFLREYSNYLTPRMGFLGADTWTAVAIYLRNLLLNLLVLVFALSAVLILPRICVGLSQHLHDAFASGSYLLFGVLIVVLLLIALFFLTANMRLFLVSDERKESPWFGRQEAILPLIAIPLFVAAWIAACWLWFDRQEWSWLRWAIFGGAFYGVLWTVCGGLALWSGKKSTTQPASATAAPPDSRYAALFSVLGASIAGAAGGLLFKRLGMVLQGWKGQGDAGLWLVVSFGPPLVTLVFMLVGSLHLGLMGRSFPDERREWWGRLGGWLFIFSLVWALAFAIAVFSPLGVVWAKRTAAGLGAGWILSTLAGLFGGRNAGTGALGAKSWKDTALGVTSYVFVLGLLVLLTFGVTFALGKTIATPEGEAGLKSFLAKAPVLEKLGEWLWVVPEKIGVWFALPSPVCSPAPPADYIAGYWQLLKPVNTPLHDLAGVCLLCMLVAIALATRVDINEFSMHLLYRNRLVRCYLGASHAGRKPNPFTGFDGKDDLLLSKLTAKTNKRDESEHEYVGPFPVVNAALNLVAGKDLAWQERKAESFIMTPLNCGFDTVLANPNVEGEKDTPRLKKYAYRRADKYAYPDGGFYLGTAMGISGAAASPNMGYHSSPAVGFLMTVFNVRLGFWGGNPRHERTWTKPGPRRGLFYLLAELFGQTDDRSRHVYLSDGGHFENLALYELVKRRCGLIIAGDAEEDHGMTFGGLSTAIRNCREDFGIDIVIDTSRIALQPPSDESSVLHCAVGKIRYSQVDKDAEDGTLIYLKSSLTNDEPVDVLHYKSANQDFPHQSTADQWFDESQFESYRELGYHAVRTSFCDAPPPTAPTSGEFVLLQEKIAAALKLFGIEPGK